MSFLEKAEDVKRLDIKAFGFGLISDSGERVGRVWQLNVKGGRFPSKIEFAEFVDSALVELVEQPTKIEVYLRTTESKKLENLRDIGLASIESMILAGWEDIFRYLYNVDSTRKQLVFPLE